MKIQLWWTLRENETTKRESVDVDAVSAFGSFRSLSFRNITQVQKIDFTDNKNEVVPGFDLKSYCPTICVLQVARKKINGSSHLPSDALCKRIGVVLPECRISRSGVDFCAAQKEMRSPSTKSWVL